MRKLFILLSAALLTSCTTELTEEVFVAPEGYEAATPPVATRAISGAIYNEVLDLWMMPRPGAQTFAATTGQPTHYALKIYPKTEAEQREIEMMKDVQVAYIPFDYVQLTQQEVEQVAHTRSAATTFAERSPYTVTYDNVESTDGGPTGPQTYPLRSLACRETPARDGARDRPRDHPAGEGANDGGRRDLSNGLLSQSLR